MGPSSAGTAPGAPARNAARPRDARSKRGRLVVHEEDRMGGRDALAVAPARRSGAGLRVTRSPELTMPQDARFASNADGL